MESNINNKINVLHIITGDSWAGAEAVTYEVLRSLVNYNDIKLTAIILNRGIVYDRIASLEIKTYSFPGKLSFLSLVRTVCDIVKENNINVVHVHKRNEDTIALFVKLFCGNIAIIRTIHGMTEKREGLRAIKDVLYRIFDTLNLKLVFTKIIAVSHDIRLNYGWGLLKNKTTVIHNAVSSNRIIYTKERNQIRSLLFEEKDIFLFGSVGRLVPVKGFDIFLRMAKIISEISENFRFVLVGEGQKRKDLEKLALELGIAQKVRFTGFTENTYNYINSFDVFVLSSLSEGIPTVLLETAILKVPIISTNVGGVSEVLSNGESAYLVRENDPAALAEACVKTYENYSRALEQAEVAYKRVTNNFSITDAHENIAKTYRCASDK